MLKRVILLFGICLQVHSSQNNIESEVYYDVSQNKIMATSIFNEPAGFTITTVIKDCVSGNFGSYCMFQPEIGMSMIHSYGVADEEIARVLRQEIHKFEMDNDLID